MAIKRKSISVKPDVHERFRKKAAKLTGKNKRVTIAELVEVVSNHLDEIILVAEVAEELKGRVQ